MANNPSTDNYVLGKGILYFDKKNLSTGLYDGERDLGNAPAVNINVALEELAHYSARGGLKAKDKKVISEVAPTITFTLDEQSKDNVVMLFMADQEEISQGVATNLTKTLTIKKHRFFDLDSRNVGVQILNYDALSAAFTEDATLTGGTSGSTATILRVIETTGTTGTLWLHTLSAPFEDEEAITDDNGTPGSATSNGVDSLLTTALSIPKPTTGFYAPGTDFVVDTVIGRVSFPAASTITDGEEVIVKYACGTSAYTKIKGLKETIVEGFLRFVSDNPAGTNLQMKIWRASLVPSGDTALIGDDWSTFSFQGEILKDETGHPDSPYLDILMD